MTIKYDRLMNVKPGSMPAVLEMGPKFPELAKKILGDDFVGDVRFYARTLGPLNQVMWSWEVESMDEEMARGAKLQAGEEWNEMVSELMPHIESSSIGDALWMEVSKTDQSAVGISNVEQCWRGHQVCASTILDDLPVQGDIPWLNFGIRLYHE